MLLLTHPVGFLIRCVCPIICVLCTEARNTKSFWNFVEFSHAPWTQWCILEHAWKAVCIIADKNVSFCFPKVSKSHISSLLYAVHPSPPRNGFFQKAAFLTLPHVSLVLSVLFCFSLFSPQILYWPCQVWQHHIASLDSKGTWSTSLFQMMDKVSQNITAWTF